MVPRKVFDEVGGFDEELAVAYNDVDFCLKIREKGYLIVYNAWAQLYHYESLSRGSDDEKKDAQKHARQMAEAKRLRDRWPEIFKNGDPYFNPNLDYDTSDFVLKGTIPPNYSVLQKAREEVTKNDSQ
jgi:GT2 family glycosyltransferase